MSNYLNLKSEIRNGIFFITINRPDKLNALNRQTVLEIGLAIKQAKDDTAIFGSSIL